MEENELQNTEVTNNETNNEQIEIMEEVGK